MTARKHCALCNHALDERQLALIEYAQTTARFRSLPAAIVELLREAGERGLTAEELSLVTKKPVHVVSARLSGLHRENRVAFRVEPVSARDCGQCGCGAAECVALNREQRKCCPDCHHREREAVVTRETRAGKKARVHVLAPTEPGAADTAQLTREVA